MPSTKFGGPPGKNNYPPAFVPESGYECDVNLTTAATLTTAQLLVERCAPRLPQELRDMVQKQLVAAHRATPNCLVRVHFTKCGFMSDAKRPQRIMPPPAAPGLRRFYAARWALPDGLLLMYFRHYAYCFPLLNSFMEVHRGGGEEADAPVPLLMLDINFPVREVERQRINVREDGILLAKQLGCRHHSMQDGGVSERDHLQLVLWLLAEKIVSTGVAPLLKELAAAPTPRGDCGPDNPQVSRDQSGEWRHRMKLILQRAVGWKRLSVGDKRTGEGSRTGVGKGIKNEYENSDEEAQKKAEETKYTYWSYFDEGPLLYSTLL